MIRLVPDGETARRLFPAVEHEEALRAVLMREILRAPPERLASLVDALGLDAENVERRADELRVA